MSMPSIGLGTGAYTHEPGGEKECWTCDSIAYNSTRSWIEQGGRLIDAGECYGNQAEVGRAIADSGVARAELFVSSKVGWCNGSTLGYDEALRQHELNLRELGLDYIDLLMIHWPGMTKGNTSSADASCTVEANDPAGCRRVTWQALLELRDKGNDGGALAVGVSNFEKHHLEDLDAIVGGNASRAPAVNQMEFSALFHDDALKSECDKRGIAVQATAPLNTPDKNSVDHHSWPPLFTRHAVKAAAASHSVTAAQVALRWVLHQGVGLVSRSRSAAHQHENLAVAGAEGFDLTDAEVEAIGRLQRGNRTLKSYLPDPQDID